MRRWALPVALALLTAASTGGLVAVEASTAASDASALAPRPLTPVLSVRRLPEVLAASVAAQRLQEELRSWADGVDERSCAMVAGPDGETLLDRNGDEPVVPASTLKLLTATAALLDLGGEARLRTTVVGPPVVDGTIAGDVTLVGGGDPLLATAGYAARFERQPQLFTDLEGLAASVAAAGIRRIDGAVVGDDSRYDRERMVTGWPARYVTQGAVGPLSALVVNDGYEQFPGTPTSGDPFVPAADPALHAARTLTFLLQARGVEVTGPARSGAAPEGGGEHAAVESPPIGDVVAQMLRESDNSTAELLVKELGRAAGDPSTGGGTQRVLAVLRAAGVDVEGVDLADGSGLSPDNRVTCEALLGVLVRAGTGEVVRAALPVAGETGTLFDRFTTSPLAGHLVAKTGSLNTVAGLAGFVVDEDGALPFAFVLNVPPSVRLGDAGFAQQQEDLGRILLAWPQAPAAADLGPRSGSS